MPFPILVPLALVGAGWSIRAFADHNVAKEAEDDAAEDDADEDDDPNAESVWAAITNYDGLF